MSVVALVLGAGQGVRLAQGVPKAAVHVAGRSLLDWSASALARCASIDAVLPVAPASLAPELARIRATWAGPARLLEPVEGGATRQDSVARGLRAAASQEPGLEWVLVHDAARCFVRPEDADAVLAAARETGAALPVVPVGDTVKLLDGETVVRTLDRCVLGLAQTPQAFRHALLAEALARAEREGFVGTDCASLVERLGMTVRTCAGRTGNWKLTHPEDLSRAASLLAGQGKS